MTTTQVDTTNMAKTLCLGGAGAAVVSSPASNTGVQNTTAVFGGAEPASEDRAMLRYSLNRVAMQREDTHTVIIPENVPITKLVDRPVDIVQMPETEGARLDWLSFTLSGTLVESLAGPAADESTAAGLHEKRGYDDPEIAKRILTGIGLNPLEVVYLGHGGQHYEHAFSIDGVDGARFFIGGEHQKGTAHVSLSAGALAFYVTVRGLDWRGWLKYLCDLGGVKFTRVDFALDSFHEHITYERIQEAVLAGSVITRFRNLPGTEGNKPVGGDGWTFYWGVSQGSRGRHVNSETIMRCYNKQAEIEAKKGVGVDHPWVRMEAQLTGDRTNKAMYDWVAADFSAAYVVGVVVGVLDFRTPSETDSNRSRWARADWFEAFVGEVSAIAVKVQAKFRTAEDVAKWAFKQCATSFAVLREAFGDGVIEDILEHGKERMTARHRRLIEASPDDWQWERAGAAA